MERATVRQLLSTAWGYIGKTLGLISLMMTLPKLIEIGGVIVTHGWLSLFMNLKTFVLFFILAFILVVLSEHIFHPGLRASAFIALVISIGFPIYTYLVPPVVHCAHYKDPTQIAVQAKSLMDLHCSLPMNYSIFQGLYMLVRSTPNLLLVTESHLDLPYIGGEAYLLELHKHVCTLPVKRTLVVWGPKSIGKTEGLLRASLAWNRQGRIVMLLSMKGFKGNYNDFVIMLRQLILDYIGTYPFSYGDIHILQNCLSSSHPSSNRTDDILSHYLDQLGFSEAARHRASGFTIWQEQWRDYVASLFNNPHDITKVDFPGLLRLLDLIALLHPKTGPILILSEVQSLDKLGEAGKALLSTIVETLEARKQPQSLVPVVFETSDALWAADYLFAPSVRRSREAFKGYLVRSFSREAGHKTLVVDHKLLTEEQYSTLWDALGGHAGSWNIVYSRLSPYETVESIITTELNEVRKLLRGVIRDFLGDKKVIDKELVELRRQKFVAKLDIENIAVKHLVATNVLFREDDDIVTPQYKLIQTAISKYLDELDIL